MIVKRPVGLTALAMTAMTTAFAALAGEPAATAPTAKEAVENLKTSANAGDPAAMMQLAQLHEQGASADGVPLVQRNHTEALKYFVMAAKGDVLPEALLAAGLCYEYGLGTAVDHKTAAAYYNKAAELKFPAAQFKLAELLVQGHIYPQNIQNGLSYLVAAFQNGHADAGFQMALINLQGRFGQPVNQAEGVRWLRDTAEMGNIPAIQTLAELCRVGVPGIIDRDLKEAMMWYLILSKVNSLPQQAAQQATAVRNGMTQAEIQEADDEAVKWLRGLEIAQKERAEVLRKTAEDRIANYKAINGAR